MLDIFAPSGLNKQSFHAHEQKQKQQESRVKGREIRRNKSLFLVLESILACNDYRLVQIRQIDLTYGTVP
jgi:hypothetical protein